MQIYFQQQHIYLYMIKIHCQKTLLDISILLALKEQEQ